MKRSSTPLAKRVRVHEKTVQAIANDDLKTTKKRRSGKSLAEETLTIKKVNDDVLRTALAMANGNRKLILIIDENDVVVMNYPNQFQRSDFKDN